MIILHFTGHWVIVSIMAVFAIWFVYQDLSSMTIHQTSVLIFLFTVVTIRFFGQFQGFFDTVWTPGILWTIFMISAPIIFLCLKKWMGWGDFFVIIGLLLILHQKDMPELIGFSSLVSSLTAVVLLILRQVDIHTPVPFLPFVWIGYFFASFFDFRFLI